MAPRTMKLGEHEWLPLRTLRPVCAALLVAALAVAGLACVNLRTGEAEVYGIAKFKLPAFPKTGSHAVLIFSEMHYQPSYRAQEGPRLLPPPESVPVTGKELVYTAEEYKALQAPDTAASAYRSDPAKAEDLYRVNCMVCHGCGLRGEGLIVSFMTKGPFPADLLNEITVKSTDGELFSFISAGGRQGLAATSRGLESSSPMPEFRLLLTEDERWMLVQYLRAFHAGR